jgi:FkbM family methyltransferase
MLGSALTFFSGNAENAASYLTLNTSPSTCCTLYYGKQFFRSRAKSAIRFPMQIERFYGHSVYMDRLNRQSVVIDLGANRGRFATAIYRRCGCIPFCVEPNPSLCALIKSESNFGVCNAAVAAQHGRRFLQVATDDECSSLMTPTISPLAHQVECDVITLPELFTRLKLIKVNLLKLDIEGTEIEVLLNLPLETLNIVDQLTVEFHESIGMGTVQEAMTVFKHLKNAGFSVVRGSFSDFRDVLFLNRRSLGLDKVWQVPATLAILRNGFARLLSRLQQRDTESQ